MQPFRQHEGLVAVLDRSDVDTDQIIPKQFLKRIERTGFEDFLFHDWRYHADGRPNPEFPLNQPEFQGASILVVGRNFGCGSSREHAVWSLENYGIRVLMASSFADIFFNNCFKNGVLPIVLSEQQVAELMRRATGQPGYRLSVDLERQRITDSEGLDWEFAVDEFRRHCLLHGLDDIALTLQHEQKIAAFEESLENASRDAAGS